jgi:hypothetical protein
MQNEHRLAVVNDMNMGGAMIVWIDHDPEAADAQDRGHRMNVAEPKRLGKAGCTRRGKRWRHTYHTKIQGIELASDAES